MSDTVASYSAHEIPQVRLDYRSDAPNYPLSWKRAIFQAQWRPVQSTMAQAVNQTYGLRENF